VHHFFSFFCLKCITSFSFSFFLNASLHSAPFGTFPDSSLERAELRQANINNRSTAPLPDTGQWLLLALNERLPQNVVGLLRARIINLHHYLMLFIMLGFSALFDCIKGPGLGIATRYMFTMAVGRFLRTITFLATILPSARPWCAEARYRIPEHPHAWAQKYYAPYASDPRAIHRVILSDMPYG
jgi:hypothetical protein